MDEQKFQPGDRVKVTMELTVNASGAGFSSALGLVSQGTVTAWSGIDHIDVELIERPEPPREPGLYLCMYMCAYADAPCALRWDGTNWLWPVSGWRVPFQDEVTVLGTVNLDDGVEL